MSFGGGRGNGKDFSMGNFMDKESGDTESSDKTNDNNTSSETPGGFGGGFGMGSDDVKLKYTDDDIDSYSNIFNNAKTAVDKADKKRLISSLKALSEQSDLENTVDVEEVIRYFVVHDFLVNGDSYTGQMIHNYYLYEKNGQFSMIPWDYNLAYGSFMGGNASSSVNSPIDTPVSNGMSDRPMIAWIFDNEEYTEQYHQLFSEFLDSVDFEKLVADTAELIDKYVEKDPTKFCTYDEFKTGVEAISRFCTLRAESVSGQLDGTIPSTTEGQKEDGSALIDTDGLNTSDMGSMGGGMGGFGGQKGGFGRNSSSKKADTSDTSKKTDNSEIVQTSNTSSFSVKMLSNIQPLANEDSSSRSGKPQRGNGEKPDFGGQPPQGFGGDMPDDFDPSNMPDFGGQPPQGFDGEMPDDFDPNNMPDGAPSFGDTEKTGDENANSSETEKVTEAEASSENTEKPAPNADENSSSAPQNENKSRGGERPDMGGFSPMDDSPQQDNTTAYILLGVSMFVLLFGLGFALKFRR
ncbi:CotH protein [Ruminococcus sp. XPD3002]|nr:CotH protein [Ruminococcus flavefaciens]